MKLIVQGLGLFVVLSLLAGVAYPLLITGLGQMFWHDKSNGSLIMHGNKIVGSELIAQQFKETKYFWPRPSASNFETIGSAGSNLGPTSRTLKEHIEKRQESLRKAHGTKTDAIPADLLTASGSGLDPHISLEAATMQMDRVADARGFDNQQRREMHELIKQLVEERQIGIFGEKRINVLSLNLHLDRCCGAKR